MLYSISNQNQPFFRKLFSPYVDLAKRARASAPEGMFLQTGSLPAAANPPQSVPSNKFHPFYVNGLTLSL
jgi:hypothetical protein